MRMHEPEANDPTEMDAPSAAPPAFDSADFLRMSMAATGLPGLVATTAREGHFVAALLDAIGAAPPAPGATPQANWVTPWGNDREEPHSEEHEQYTKYVQELVRQSMPWLPYLLNSAEASVLAWPGSLSFAVAIYHGAWFDVPGFEKHTQMLPWVVEGETPH